MVDDQEYKTTQLIHLYNHYNHNQRFKEIVLLTCICQSGNRTSPQPWVMLWTSFVRCAMFISISWMDLIIRLYQRLAATGALTHWSLYTIWQMANIPGGKVRGQLTVPCGLYQIMPGQCITDLGPSLYIHMHMRKTYNQMQCSTGIHKKI